MKRTESQALRSHYDSVIKEGSATECIRERCLSWWYCSMGGRITPPVCDADLSTGFHHRIAEDEYLTDSGCEGYRDPDKAGQSGVFKRKKKRH